MLKRFGWFDMPGIQRGERTLQDQLMGMRPAFAEAKDKRVLDVGSAEGLIAKAMLEAGAASVECIESNPDYADEARRQLRGLPAVVHRWDLNNGLPSVGQCEIALLLAILHKLREPIVLLSQLIEVVKPELVVIRYPRNNDGVLVDGRSQFKPQDVPGFLKANGYSNPNIEMGPRRERVAYFRRQPGNSSPLTPHSSRG